MYGTGFQIPDTQLLRRIGSVLLQVYNFFTVTIDFANLP